MTNREIAQEISSRIGNSPVPFDSVYSIALQIYNELGGEETQFDSVYSILLEILPLVEGGGGKAIEEVSELPDAEENKDKLFRLDNGEKDVYAAKLLSSETITTNRLPDEQQIDKAYLYEGDESIYYYKGTYEITCSDGILNWYLWKDDVRDSMVATEENFPSDFVNAPIIGIDAETGDWTVITETSATTTMSVSEVENTDTMGGWGIMALIPAIYNAPESAQIGNATFTDNNNGANLIYAGNEVTFTYDGEELTGYTWEEEGGSDRLWVSSKPASEIYFYNDEENLQLLSDVQFYYYDDPSEAYSLSYTDISNFYISQLNASESTQIDNAKIVYDNKTWVYTGEIGTASDTVITYTGYKWVDGDDYIISTKKASEVYYHTSLGFDLIMTPDNKFISYSESNVIQLDTNNGDILDIFIYQRTETTEEWDWENVITPPAIIEVEETPEEIDNTTKEHIYRIPGDALYAVFESGEPYWGVIASQEEVLDSFDYLEEEKANKVDFTIPVDMATQATDWTVLNTAPEGIYRVKVVADMMGTSVTMLEGWATVTNSMGTIAQTLVLTQMIPNAQGSPLTIHNRVSANGGTAWADYEFNLGVINDNNSSSESTYSSSKINSLISALEARINVLEGNTTVE